MLEPLLFDMMAMSSGVAPLPFLPLTSALRLSNSSTRQKGSGVARDPRPAAGIGKLASY